MSNSEFKGLSLASINGAIAASLSKFNDVAFDPGLVTRIKSAHQNHGIPMSDLINKLPGELEKYGTDAVNGFLQKKHWSHIKSQKHHPELANNAANAIWEDGAANIGRGAQNMTWQERCHASIDNHFDGLLAATRSSRFLERTLGNAFEAGIYAAIITAVDQLLIHRNTLVNGSNEEREVILIKILDTSKLYAAGAIPISIFIALALMLIPSLEVVMVPLGIIGVANLGIRLIASAINNPTQQEKEAIRKILELYT